MQSGRSEHVPQPEGNYHSSWRILSKTGHRSLLSRRAVQDGGSGRSEDGLKALDQPGHIDPCMHLPQIFSQ
jgi:hypothetical protein